MLRLIGTPTIVGRCVTKKQYLTITSCGEKVEMDMVRADGV